MSLVQVGLDLLFDKRCLIMGFSTKPVAIAALQSTFLCRSADPSLGVLKDGLYDLFWLVKSRDFTRGGKVTARTTTRTCHQSHACDLYPQCQSRERKRHPQKIPASFSLSRNIQVSTCTPHLNFNGCLKLCSHTHTHREIHTQTAGLRLNRPRESTFSKRPDS